MIVKRGELEVSGDSRGAVISNRAPEYEDVGVVPLSGDELRWLQSVALPAILSALPTSEPHDG